MSKPTAECDLDIQTELFQYTGHPRAGFPNKDLCHVHRHNPRRMRDDNLVEFRLRHKVGIYKKVWINKGVEDTKRALVGPRGCVKTTNL